MTRWRNKTVNFNHIGLCDKVAHGWPYASGLGSCRQARHYGKPTDWLMTCWQTVTPMVIGSTLTNVCLSNGEYDACLKYSGCRTYPQWPLHRNHPWFSCIGRSAAHTR